MRVAVVGAGGVGGYFGGKLAHAGIDTTFLVRGATLAAMCEHGLRVDSIQGDFVVHPVQATDRLDGTFDAILLAVKAWQLPDAVRQVLPVLSKDTMIVPLENGIDAPDVIASIAGREHAAGGLCAIVSFIVEPGHIRHAASEPFVMFGELDNTRSARVERLLEAFTKAGVNAQIPPDIHHSLWSKFLFIAPLSATGALTRTPVGAWRTEPEVRALVTSALEEIVALAKARGVDLGPDAVAKTWQRYDGMALDATSSLQRDVMDGKPSELDAQLGAIVRLARESGVAVPVSETLYRLLLPQERLARS